MRHTSTAGRIVIIAMFAMGMNLALAQSKDGGSEKKAPAPKTNARAGAPKDAKDNAKERADEQRNKAQAEYDALVKQLKDATAEQRKQILEKMKEQRKAFEAAQAALHKQIRDEQRRQRRPDAK